MQSAHPSNYIRTLPFLIAFTATCCPSLFSTLEDGDLYTLNQTMTLLCWAASHPTRPEPQPSQSPAKPCALSQQVFVQISPSERELLGLLYLKWNLHIPTLCPQNISTTQIRYYFLTHFLSVSVLDCKLQGSAWFIGLITVPCAKDAPCVKKGGGRPPPGD